jgi:hypothetical protein
MNLDRGSGDPINYPLLRTYGVWQIKKMLTTYDES